MRLKTMSRYAFSARARQLHISRLSLFLFLSGCLASAPSLQVRDDDFVPSEATPAPTGTSSPVLIASIGIVIALLGFVVFFFVGYYVGSTQSRREIATVVVRSNAQPAQHHHHHSSNAFHQSTRLPLPPPPVAVPVHPNTESNQDDSMSAAVGLYRIKKTG